MAVIQFSEKQDLDWTKAIQPKGSRMIAYAEGESMIDPQKPAYTAVFQDVKKPRKLYMFQKDVKGGIEEKEPDSPLAAFKRLVDRSYKKIAFMAPQEEVLALISDASLAQEEVEKAREISQIQEKLDNMIDTLEDISDWEKYKKVEGSEAKLDMIYSLSTIAWFCTSMAANISINLNRKDKEKATA